MCPEAEARESCPFLPICLLGGGDEYKKWITRRRHAGRIIIEGA